MMTSRSIENIDIDQAVQEIQEKFGIVGRENELRRLIMARIAGRHAIIEGPVGVGKTTLAHAIAAYFDQGFIRIDGDERYTEAKLVGHFEPPLVVQKGWTWDAFVPGPLTQAMKNGSVLFINEANRLIEATQNVLLPALDEGIVVIPKLGPIKAKEGFFVVATQNPESYIGTTVLSEALKDRFVWVKLGHQNYESEYKIVLHKLENLKDKKKAEQIASLATKIARATRKHPQIRRGASIRGAIDLAKILSLLNELKRDSIIEVGIMALVPKIELEDGVERDTEDVVAEVIDKVLAEGDFDFL